jgi:hypothetical protein
VLAGVAAIAVAVAGWLVSRAIPVTPAVAPDLVINWNPVTETWKNLRFAYGSRVVWLSMLGISWFWFYGATFLTQFPNFAKDVLGGDEHVGHVPPRALLRRHWRRLAPVRAPVGTQGGDRLVPFGSIGLTLFASTCGSRRATCTLPALPGSGSSCNSRDTCASWRTSC